MRIATLGVSDLIIVASGNDVLILPRGRSQDGRLPGVAKGLRDGALGTGGALGRLIRSVEIFGFHLATLDLRQNSAVHERVVAELLKVAGVEADYAMLSESQRVTLLRHELSSARPLASPFATYSDETASELAIAHAAAAAHRRYGPGCITNYIVSMAQSVSDLLEVHVLLKEAGLYRPGDEPHAAIMAVPLFETIGDLEAAPGIMAEWFALPEVRALGAQRGYQEVMIGYSDSNKDGGTFTQVGTIRSQGAEFSVSGKLTSRLDLVGGGVFLRPRVVRSASAVGAIGDRPVGLSSHLLIANLNWRVPGLNGLSLDLATVHRGATPATTDNLVILPPRARVDLGGRYRFKLATHDATFRLQMSNVFDQIGFGIAGSGVYTGISGRYVTGYLAIDRSATFHEAPAFSRHAPEAIGENTHQRRGVGGGGPRGGARGARQKSRNSGAAGVFFGRGVKASKAKALEAFRASSEQSYAPGENALGYMTELGLGLKADANEAYQLYSDAGQANLPVASYNEARLRETGSGTDTDAAA
eukprot:gene30457-40471_t